MTQLQQQARALGDPTRHAIFRYLAESRDRVGIAELTEHFALNHNAIRQHLAKLLAARLVIETKAPTNGPGRPRLVYVVDPAADGRWGTAGPYERLSRLLVEVLRTGLSPEDVGRRSADEFRVPTASTDATAGISGAMARQGFEPEVRSRGARTEIVLHKCPFETAARADRETICSLHLGIAEGLADGTHVVVEELIGNDPRRADCRLRLSTSDVGAQAASGTLTLRGRKSKA